MLHQLQRWIFPVLASVIVLLAAGCGSGGSGSGSGGGGGGLFAGGGIGGTGITSGTVTGFGSVFVNGIEFETDSSSFDVDDDNAASQNDLDIGMVVTVVGTVNDDGVSGDAVSIEYDDEVEGPIANNPVEDADMTTKTFTVFDIMVIADKNTTVFSATDYASLSKNDMVEISGFFDGSGVLTATWIEKQGELSLGSSEVEIKGTVTDFNDVDTFTLDGVTVMFDGTTDLSEIPGGVIADGQYVEVKGVLNAATAIFALRIELEDEGFEDSNNAVSIEGLVTDYNGPGDFKVSGQQVDASAADFSPQSLAASLGNGDKVEVEGLVTGGVLRAAEVEQRGGTIKIGAQVTGVDVFGATLSLEVVQGEPAITVLIDAQTQMEDDELDVKAFSLADIKVGDELIIEGFVASGGAVATQLQRKVLEAYELQGPVAAAGGNDLAGSVTILGVTIATDEETGFEAANEDGLSGTVFYQQVVPGDLVEFQDDVPVNGVADEVGFED